MPTSLCPCTETPVAVCVDATGNRLMITEPKGAIT
jgi:hypothetical protein